MTIPGLLANEGDMLLTQLKCPMGYHGHHAILCNSNRFNFENNIYLARSGLSLNNLASMSRFLECNVDLIGTPICVGLGRSYSMIYLNC